MLRPPLDVAHVPAPEGGPDPNGDCLLRSIRTVRAALPATFESLGTLLSRHRAVTRVAAAALSFTLIIATSQQTATTQARPEPAPLVPESLLPQNVGIGVATDREVTISFEESMDPESVESSLQLLPAVKADVAWNDDATELTIAPQRRWRTDERYLLVVPEATRLADGVTLGRALRFTFSTQAAPSVAEFQVRLVAGDIATEPPIDTSTAGGTSLVTSPAVAAGTFLPTKTATEVSATSAISIGFTTPMDRADVEDHFGIAPHVEGELEWQGSTLVFHPTERLEPGARYTVSVIGAHDFAGNPLGGDANFSFIVQEGAQLTKTAPEDEASDVEPETVEMWFSAPMEVDATNEAFSLTDTSTGALVGGILNWNEAGTQLVYRPDRPFAGGGTFEVALDGGLDEDGNRLSLSWSFTTTAPPPPPPAPERSTTSTRSAPAPPPAAPATSLAGYALNQVNAARAAYGFAPVVLDPAISAVASAHAWDQARNNYFSHTGLNGSTRESRLRAGGVSFSWSGENQCYLVGRSEQATLDWCHQQFMAEPYPGHFNHIANILNPKAKRMGVGIATVGGKTIITWNFTD